MWIHGQEASVDEFLAAGDIEQAINQCESIAGYYDSEEANCDQAGEYAEGMRASRKADYWRGRARELRQQQGSE